MNVCRAREARTGSSIAPLPPRQSERETSKAFSLLALAATPAMADAERPCPWLGFARYFPGVEFDEGGIEHQLANYFHLHYSTTAEAFPSVRYLLPLVVRIFYPPQDFFTNALRIKEGALALPVSFPVLREAGGDAFVSGLRDNSEAVLPALGVACYQVRASRNTFQSTHFRSCSVSLNCCHRAGPTKRAL